MDSERNAEKRRRRGGEVNRGEMSLLHKRRTTGGASQCKCNRGGQSHAGQDTKTHMKGKANAAIEQ